MMDSLPLLLVFHLMDIYSVQHLFVIVASVLHLGNIQFVSDSKGHAFLNNTAELRWVSNVRQ